MTPSTAPHPDSKWRGLSLQVDTEVSKERAQKARDCNCYAEVVEVRILLDGQEIVMSFDELKKRLAAIYYGSPSSITTAQKENPECPPNETHLIQPDSQFQSSDSQNPITESA